MQEDLRSAPLVTALPGDRVEVVFEGLPGSRRWKDWLVEITYDLDKLEGLSFECFFDHVAGKPHPASLRRQQP